MEKLRKFFREVKTEIKKTHWPNKKELWGATGVVLFILLVTGVYFFVLDLVFSGALSALFKLF
ncbi:preprotein translocase subunit SecE [Thermosipho melanesiensis]|uniref:Protein translocase subunit SecE n=2 Tax=Thermosipho melanesiensis TaxID=46541 RepID=A6LKQ3_THEM4|nr:preprotein translocase subunit SecE [Thermosipho melanesiensis]ABR30504.1 preprotein translocase, SecE subunit [Thermosipho melanesiensis BI429]APT73655.1 preprotein translocase subunit SecE [Thermosipho melanesiensis]OOC35597.1 preprotein translocase subunit SecE [Thermosipho melanesiensis]OOC39271.1 preprotein translocase subunit SecE [Thermosipho melanesiensis]OOC39357.1 preprotein translocase subunit SecE [Thermosipho melanesiensis]